VQPIVQTFSSILKSSTQTNATSLQAPAPAPAPKYNVIVKPAQNCKGVKTSLDTKKILTSKTPRELGYMLCGDTSVRIKSRCPSVLKLGESAELKKLKLTTQLLAVSARLQDTSWTSPRRTVLDAGTVRDERKEAGEKRWKGTLSPSYCYRVDVEL
jgi:hypothetical protein